MDHEVVGQRAEYDLRNGCFVDVREVELFGEEELLVGHQLRLGNAVGVHLERRVEHFVRRPRRVLVSCGLLRSLSAFAAGARGARPKTGTAR